MVADPPTRRTSDMEMNEGLPSSFRLAANLVFHDRTLTVLVPAGDDGFGELRTYLRVRASELGERVILLVVLRPGVRADAAILREEVKALVNEEAESLAHLVLAIDGVGFFASTFMSMASMLFMHTRGSHTPMRVFKNLDAASEYVASLLNADWPQTFIASIRLALDG